MSSLGSKEALYIIFSAISRKITFFNPPAWTPFRSRSTVIFGKSENDVVSTDADKNWPVIG